MPKYKDIRSLWEEFEKNALASNAPDSHRDALRTSFYAGSAASISFLIDTYANSDPVIFTAMVEKLLLECGNYFQGDFAKTRRNKYQLNYNIKNNNKN